MTPNIHKMIPNTENLILVVYFIVFNTDNRIPVTANIIPKNTILYQKQKYGTQYLQIIPSTYNLTQAVYYMVFNTDGRIPVTENIIPNI